MLTALIMPMLIAGAMHSPSYSAFLSSNSDKCMSGILLISATPRVAPGPIHGDDPHDEVHSDPYNYTTGNGSDPYGGTTGNGSDPYGGKFPGAPNPRDPYGGNVPD